MPSASARTELAPPTDPTVAGFGQSLLPTLPLAILALADGSTFLGHSVGAAGETVGEVVFNTAMTGYQEILTDPSYLRQIVTLTCAHIGNVGANPEDAESDRIQAAGLIVKDVPQRVSNFRATTSLPQYLEAAGTVAIAGVDTRRLTRLLRSTGAQNGCICTFAAGTVIGPSERQHAVRQAQAAASMSGLDLARVASTRERYTWDETTWQLGRGHGRQTAPQFHVVAYDFGVKRNILRLLASHGCSVTVVPAETSARDVTALKPDGIFLSNGPGDPEPCQYAIRAAHDLIEAGLPTFGICLGHQIMALASGAKTYKMKFGHHGANHPVKDLASGRVSITSQNHGFAVDQTSLPPNLVPTHVSLFDGTLQGLARTDKPAFCFQGHPEASPGPHDIGYLFDRFVALMAKEPTHA